jgi:hypothetical protein
MVAGRDERRKKRRWAVARSFPPEHVEAALDVLDLVDLAWRNVYRETTPSDVIVDDVLMIAQGDIASLARAAHLAVTDWRDVRVHADHLRRERRRRLWRRRGSRG